MSEAGGPTPREVYAERSARFTAECERLGRRSRRLSQVRTLAFIVVIAAGLLLERRPGPVPAVLLATSIAGFIALVVRHRAVRRREAWYRDLVALNEEGLLRLDRAWDALPARPPFRPPGNHAYADDMDLFGRAAVAQLFGSGGSAQAAAMVDEWLLSPAAADVVRGRQRAVAELAPLVDFRESLALHGRRARAAKLADIERFLRWAESEPWFRHRRLLGFARWALPLAFWALLALHATGVTGPLWVPVALGTIALSMVTAGRVHRTFNAAFGREGMFEHFPGLLGVAAGRPFEAPLLQRLRARITLDGRTAERRLADLRRIMHYADVRLSSIHVIVQAVTMWDHHVLAALERWQAENGRSVRDWLQATAGIEALAALATLAHDEPGWTFPEIDEGATPRFDAIALGHPLIPAAHRVDNDVRVGPPGSFLLVTGSNMSGKSTLLRSIGANTVLALAGAPCCARRLVLTPLRLWTSIRVQDSLARGVSYFMAELERLKRIVDAAEEARATDATLLFLLDEILHGTNTAERRIAASRVIRHLVDLGAIGAVTTHDLELAEDDALAPVARLVHFREDLGDDALSFDYRLRDGLATSTNALKLMAWVGLPAP